MADEEAQMPHPGLAEAERRVRAAIAGAREHGDAAMLALLHADLGAILAALHRMPEAVEQFRTSVGYLDLLRAEGSHEEQRLTRLTSLATPPPDVRDYNIDRLEGEVRVALVEALVAEGDLAAARAEAEIARPFTRGVFRRRLRKRLDHAAATLAADPAAPGTADVHALYRQLRQVDDPAAQRALRLRLANGHLDTGDFGAAARESLLLIRAADEAGDAVVRAGARQVLGLALEAQGRSADALPILVDAFRDLQDHGDAQGMIGMAEALATRLLESGDAAGAATVLRTSAAAAAQTGAGAAEVSITTMLGVVLDAGGDRASAVAALTSAAEAAEAPLARADALHSLAVTLSRSPAADDLVEALSLLDEAKGLYRQEELADRVAGCDHEAAAMLGRHASFDAAATRYRAALGTYEALPENERDAGSWPDEVADCRANLAWLAGDRTQAHPGLFASGGHTMSHIRM